MNPFEQFLEFPQLFMNLAENDTKLCIVKIVKIEPLRVILDSRRRRTKKS